MNAFDSIIVSTFLVSLISLVGVFTLSMDEEKLKRITIYLVSLSAGGLLGAVFIHLLPEALEQFSTAPILIYVLIGFVLFFAMEKFLHWHHCRENRCKVHSLAYMNLIGDAVHNFTDGLIMAAGFLTSPAIGLITVFAIALHEIPQEIGDFGVLIYAGLTRKKALFYNFIVALTAMLGGLVGYFLSSSFNFIVPFLMPFAAGGFLYISASDLVPEIREEHSVNKTLINFAFFFSGIIIMFLVKLIR